MRLCGSRFGQTLRKAQNRFPAAKRDRLGASRCAKFERACSSRDPPFDLPDGVKHVRLIEAAADAAASF